MKWKASYDLPDITKNLKCVKFSKQKHREPLNKELPSPHESWFLPKKLTDFDSRFWRSVVLTNYSRETDLKPITDYEAKK